MRRVLASKKNTKDFKKFLIPKSEDVLDKNWVEIEINFVKNVFIAQKAVIQDVDDEWESYNDYTFPGSLLNEFLTA